MVVEKIITKYLKSDLQKINNPITNILSAIEKGITTETTKSRLEGLETLRKDLEEKLVIEESHERHILTKEDIQNFFKYTMKQCPDKAIELFVKKVYMYDNKIETYLYYAVNQANADVTISKKVFSEAYSTERQYRGGITKTYTKQYNIYVVI